MKNKKLCKIIGIIVILMIPISLTGCVENCTVEVNLYNESESQPQWLDNNLKNTTEKNIILISHHPPLDILSSLLDLSIRNERIKTIIENNHIDVWVYGHLHYMGIDRDAVRIINNTTYVNTASITKHSTFYNRNTTVESFLIHIVGDTVTIKFRDHIDKVWSATYYTNLRYKSERDIIIWFYSDIHSNWDYFQTAIDDIKSVGIDIDMSFGVGDLIHNSYDDIEPYHKLYGIIQSKLGDFYSIGNHEIQGDIDVWETWSKFPRYYDIIIGNLKIIVISPVDGGYY